MPASTCASLRNISANAGLAARSGRRYLMATSSSVSSCLASTTSPNPPEPSTFSSVYPGTFQSGIQIPPGRCGLSALNDDGGRAASLGRTENLEDHGLGGTAVAAALDGDGHEHGLLAHVDRLAERLGRLPVRRKHPLIGERPGAAVGRDPPGYVNAAAGGRSLLGDRHAGHLKRGVMESQEKHDAAGRQQQYRERRAEYRA